MKDFTLPMLLDQQSQQVYDYFRPLFLTDNECISKVRCLMFDDGQNTGMCRSKAAELGIVLSSKVEAKNLQVQAFAIRQQMVHIGKENPIPKFVPVKKTAQEMRDILDPSNINNSVKGYLQEAIKNINALREYIEKVRYARFLNKDERNELLQPKIKDFEYPEFKFQGEEVIKKGVIKPILPNIDSKDEVAEMAKVCLSENEYAKYWIAKLCASRLNDLLKKDSPFYKLHNDATNVKTYSEKVGGEYVEFSLLPDLSPAELEEIQNLHPSLVGKEYRKYQAEADIYEARIKEYMTAEKARLEQEYKIAISVAEEEWKQYQTELNRQQNLYYDSKARAYNEWNDAKSLLLSNYQGRLAELEQEAEIRRGEHLKKTASLKIFIPDVFRNFLINFQKELEK